MFLMYNYGCFGDVHVVISVEFFFNAGQAVSMAFLHSYTDLVVKLKGIVLWYACSFSWFWAVAVCKTVMLKMKKTAKFLGYYVFVWNVRLISHDL